MTTNLYDVTHLFEENDIQELLCNVGKTGLFDDNSCDFFGIPNYLLKVKVRSKQKSFSVKYGEGLHYNYEPDCICEYNDNVYIIELKRSVKYEPLGIPEVIHHAVQQRNQPENNRKTVIPVLISSFNMWNRTVVKELNEKHNLQLMYYEIYILSKDKEFSRRVRKISNNDIIWLYDPSGEKNPTNYAEVKKNNRTLTYQCKNNSEIYTLR
jgi:hypothetical protein